MEQDGGSPHRLAVNVRRDEVPAKHRTTGTTIVLGVPGDPALSGLKGPMGRHETGVKPVILKRTWADKAGRPHPGAPAKSRSFALTMKLGDVVKHKHIRSVHRDEEPASIC